MEKRPLGFVDLLASGSWYAIPAIWGFFVFIRMAIWQGGILAIFGLVAFTAVALWCTVHMIIQWVRAGKQPTQSQQRAAFHAILSPVFSVMWAGFAAGCVASMIVVIELNDPFTKEAVDRVVQEHTTLFWAVAGAGVIIGVGWRIWSLSRPGQVAAANKAGDPGAPEGETPTHRT